MIILHNAKIYTNSEATPITNALGIVQDRIIALGDERTILKDYGGSHTNVDLYDMKGMAIIPGLIDAHIHLKNYALNLNKVDCETSTREECIERVKQRVINLKEDSWLLGHGWNQNMWVEGYGSANELDRVTPMNPVYLTAKSLHAAWVNSRALQIAKIRKHTPDPQNGRIDRDADGNPTGILFESAMNLVSNCIPEPDLEEIIRSIELAQLSLHRMGITSVHDFDRRTCFIALQKLHERGKLEIRVVKSIPEEDLTHAIGIGLRSGFGDDFLRIGSVKLFADGALGPQTAAMLEPYTGETNNRGLLMIDSEALLEIGRVASSNGLSLAVHAIGDYANHEILKGYKLLREFEIREIDNGSCVYRNGENNYNSTPSHTRPLRHRIEHVQLIHPDDSNKLSELGIIASMQPIHATSDMDMAEKYWGSRCLFAYPWKTQISHGAKLAFGSDAPVESPNPFWGLHAAVTRCKQHGYPGETGWIPQQRISLQEALNAYTIGSAYAAGMEDRLGVLSPGYLADLVVIDQDLFTCNPDELWRITPVRTMVGGKWMF